MVTRALFDPAVSGVQHLAGAAQSSDHGIVSRTMLDADGIRLTLFTFAAGQELTEHTSSSRALVQILSGACEFTLAGRKTPLRAGDLLHLPPGLPHAVLATEPFAMLLTLIRPRATGSAA